MELGDSVISDNTLTLPKNISRILKWKYPFYRLPKLEEYNEEIIKFSKEFNKLPFYVKLDINNDGREEIVLIQKSIIGGLGRVLIISMINNKLRFDKIRWERPVNALFFDYLIDESLPRSYQKKDLFLEERKGSTTNSKQINVAYSHIITKGYITRIIYWDGGKYCQEKVSMLNN